jgi:hypothetical protein
MTAKTKLNKIGLLLLAFLLVAGMRLWALSRQTPHLEKIAREIGSIPQYRVGIYPNHTGSSLIFYQETETGLGTFFCETATGKTKLLFEEKEKGYCDRFRLQGWSPDDNILAFATLPDSEGTIGSGAITLCKGLTGEVITMIPTEAYAYDSQFAWLTTRSFVYSTYSQRSWLVYAEKPDGSWGEIQVVKRFAVGKLADLVGISPHSIAWRNQQAVWTYDFVTGAMAKIWESTNNVLSSLVLSERSGNLLLKCKDKDGAFQIELRPPRNGNPDASVVVVTRPYPNPAQVNLNERKGRFIFNIKTAPEAAPVAFVWAGLMRYQGLGGNYLFFAGSQSNDVPGIWQFDTQSKTVRKVTSAINTPLKWAKITGPITGIFTNKNRGAINYHLWQPVHVLPGKKYPLIIGQTMNIWDPFQQIAANAGWFFATSGRPSWNRSDMSAFPNEMTDFREAIAKEFPGVDINKVFIIVSSVQTPGANELFKEKPGLAKGLIFQHPAGLTSLPDVHAGSILILSGTDDRLQQTEGLIKTQDEAFNNGNYVNLLIQDGVQHSLNRSLDSERELCWQFARFLSQNK